MDKVQQKLKLLNETEIILSKEELEIIYSALAEVTGGFDLENYKTIIGLDKNELEELMDKIDEAVER